MLIRSSQQGIDFGTCEKLDQSPRETLAGDSQHALNLCRVGWHFEGSVPEEGMDRRQPQIPAANAQALMLVQAIQERHDQRGIDFSKLKGDGAYATAPRRISGIDGRCLDRS